MIKRSKRYKDLLKHSLKGKKVEIKDGNKFISIEPLANDLIIVPKTNHFMFCQLVTIVLQLFAYYIAVGKKLNVDQPRNLAKSVTVE